MLGFLPNVLPNRRRFLGYVCQFAIECICMSVYVHRSDPVMRADLVGSVIMMALIAPRVLSGFRYM